MKQLKSLYYLTVFYLHVSRHKSCVFVADICFLFWHHSHREREREHSQMKEKNILLFVITDRCHGSLYLFDERKQWKYTGEKKKRFDRISIRVKRQQHSADNTYFYLCICNNFILYANILCWIFFSSAPSSSRFMAILFWSAVSKWKIETIIENGIGRDSSDHTRVAVLWKQDSYITLMLNCFAQCSAKYFHSKSQWTVAFFVELNRVCFIHFVVFFSPLKCRCFALELCLCEVQRK